MRNFNLIVRITLFIFLFNFKTNTYADFFDESAAALEKRIAPIGKVKIASTSSATNLQLLPIANIDNHLGKALFESKCVLCHGSGIAGAPRLGNKADWEPRIKKKSSLLKHATTGYRAMPPKGACLECSVADLEAAINYMLEQTHL